MLELQRNFKLLLVLETIFFGYVVYEYIEQPENAVFFKSKRTTQEKKSVARVIPKQLPDEPKPSEEESIQLEKQAQAIPVEKQQGHVDQQRKIEMQKQAIAKRIVETKANSKTKLNVQTKVQQKNQSETKEVETSTEFIESMQSATGASTVVQKELNDSIKISKLDIVKEVKIGTIQIKLQGLTSQMKPFFTIYRLEGGNVTPFFSALSKKNPTSFDLPIGEYYLQLNVGATYFPYKFKLLEGETLKETIKIHRTKKH